MKKVVQKVFKNKNILVKINPTILNIIEDVYDDELNEVEKHNKINISFEADANIENARIEIIKNIKQKKKKKQIKSVKTKKSETKNKKNTNNSNNVKKDKKTKKSKPDAISNPIKEIKNKKTGWWQT